MTLLTPRLATRMALTLAASALTMSAMAQDFRIGFVSTDRILRDWQEQRDRHRERRAIPRRQGHAS